MAGERSVHVLTLSMTMPLEGGVWVSADSEERKEQMRVLSGALRVVIGPLKSTV